MRKRFEVQYELGTVSIEEIEFPARCRDQLPAVLRALQYLYVTPELNEKVFALLEKKIIGDKQKTGRLGMTLWEILVFAVLRLARDADYDHLHYMSETDRLFRAMLGAEQFGVTQRRYPLQTIKDNVSLLDEETLKEINALVVEAGHQLVKKNDALDVNIDSYVFESNVHFPTDLNLLLDAGRKCVELARKLTKGTSVKGWRKSSNWVKRLKSHCRKTGQLSASGGRNKAQRLRLAALDYLQCAETLQAKLEKAKPEFEKLIASEAESSSKAGVYKELRSFSDHFDKHIDLVRRRLIKGETIPHKEKIFSVFETWTEWIKKGKAGNRPELGLPIVIAKDQFGFVLQHEVMQQQHDVEITAPFGKKLLQQYAINSMSFDKNYWSPENHQELAPLVQNLIMPKKGKLKKDEYERQRAKAFVTLKRKHAGVESAINALEHHGLNRCPDRGVHHFKSYVALGVVAYNLHKLGNILEKKERKALSKSSRYRKAA